MRTFGDHKNKLALLMFGGKVQGGPPAAGWEGEHLKFSLELSEEEEARLELVFAQLQAIKKRFDFSNLENYIAAVVKNFSALEKPEAMSVERLKGFLDSFCLSNFFKQTPHIANMNFLNHRDDQFVRRLDLILMVR